MNAPEPLFMHTLYVMYTSRASFTLRGFTLLLGLTILTMAQSQNLNAQAGPPVFWSHSLAGQFLRTQSAISLSDITLGLVADPQLMDEDTRSAYDFLRKSFSDLVFGNIIDTLTLTDRRFLMKRRIGELKSRTDTQAKIAISASITKESLTRIFSVRVTSTKGIYVVELSLKKENGLWLFEDILSIEDRTIDSKEGFMLNKQRVREEGWIPYGN